MQLTLSRDIFGPTYTAGRLAVDGVPECFTVELATGDGGVGCAIPEGTFRVQMAWSPHFQTRLAHVEHVPGRTGIEIHDGNTPKDTDGCILVGVDRLAPDLLGHSEVARQALQAKIGRAVAEGEAVWLTVTSVVPA